MTEVERKIEEWAKKQGIDYATARTLMLPGDVDAVAAQLKHAREHNAPEERACVAFWLRLLEGRVVAMSRAGI